MNDDLLTTLDRCKRLVQILTVRQVIESGIDVINAAGLNPWCINEGRAEGSERISTDFIDRAIKTIQENK